MGAIYNRYNYGFEFPKLDINFEDDKRVYQIFDDMGMMVESIIIPIFYNLTGNLDDAEIFDGLYSLN
ncbi:MAG: hypothetical protein A2Y40_05890 [Candidatus Margulisbacteria bacterium GWF2_35_9]|nr:MAG: hypothetical protein A2Y40_05890 [Candidatus Margulisbacteria bacterium GWF2_35_9]